MQSVFTDVDIYLCTNKINGHMYVGQAKQYRSGKPFGAAGRWKEHVYEALSGQPGCRHLNRAICHHGPSAFVCITLQTVAAEQADDAEIRAISEYNTFEDPNNYNLTIGGKCGYPLSTAIRELLNRKHQQDRSVNISVRDNIQQKGYVVKDVASGVTHCFCSPAISMEAKLALAEDRLKQCMEAHAKGLPPPPQRGAGAVKCDPTLPMYLSHSILKGKKAIVFSKKGHPLKRFMAGTAAQQKVRALAHLQKLGLTQHGNVVNSGTICWVVKGSLFTACVSASSLLLAVQWCAFLFVSHS